MLTHAQVWSAIDRLAERAGLSASGLARRAGLENPRARAYRPAFRIGLVAGSVGYNEPSSIEKFPGG